MCPVDMFYIISYVYISSLLYFTKSYINNTIHLGCTVTHVMLHEQTGTVNPKSLGNRYVVDMALVKIVCACVCVFYFLRKKKCVPVWFDVIYP